MYPDDRTRIRDICRAACPEIADPWGAWVGDAIDALYRWRYSVGHVADHVIDDMDDPPADGDELADAVIAACERIEADLAGDPAWTL